MMTAWKYSSVRRLIIVLLLCASLPSQASSREEEAVEASSSLAAGEMLSLQQRYQKLGEEVLAKCNPQQREQFFDAVRGLAARLADTQSAVTSLVEIPREEAEARGAPEHYSSWHKKVAAISAGILTTLCVLGSRVAENEWLKAGMLSVGAGVLYATSGIGSQLVPLPEAWGSYQSIFVRALIGAGMVVPANLLNYSAMQIGLRPYSKVSLIALGSLCGLVSGVSGTFGNLVFLHQTSNWTVIAGLLSTAFIAFLQINYALNHPAH
jgi:hypothetical protein